MELQLKLFASLRRFAPSHERIELADGMTIIDLLDKYRIPPSEIAIALVNGRHAELEQALHDGETLSLFPAIAGG